MKQLEVILLKVMNIFKNMFNYFALCSLECSKNGKKFLASDIFLLFSVTDSFKYVRIKH